MVDLLELPVGDIPGEWGDYALENKGSQEKVKITTLGSSRKITRN
jgi:hypothetical protein